MDVRTANWQYADIADMQAQKMIREVAAHERLIGVHIAWIMKKEPEKPSDGPSRPGKKVKIATTSVFSPKMAAAVDIFTASCPPDFIVEIQEQWWNKLSLRQQEAVIDHELCHMGKTSDGNFYVIDHDIQEFRGTVERYGMYLSDIEEFAASLEIAKSNHQMELFDDQAELEKRLSKKLFNEARAIADTPAYRRIAAQVAAGHVTLAAENWVWDKNGLREITPDQKSNPGAAA